MNRQVEVSGGVERTHANLLPSGTGTRAADGIEHLVLDDLVVVAEPAAVGVGRFENLRHYHAAVGVGAHPRAERGVVNPWSEKTRNLTEQVKLLKTDPGLAARLKASA